MLVYDTLRSAQRAVKPHPVNKYLRHSLGNSGELAYGALQQFYSSFTVDTVNPSEHRQTQRGLGERISNAS